MQETQCMCTAVFCGHAKNEKCQRRAAIFLKIAIGTSNSGFGPQIQLGLCRDCWVNFQRYLPGLLYSKLPWQKAG
jgi:hypothetical protein